MTQMMQGPIARGWAIILENAPTSEERDKAEAYRDIFYSGASWLFQIVKGFGDDKEMKQYVSREIEAELKQWRSTRRRASL